MGELLGLADLRSSGARLASSPGAAVATLLLGIGLGGTGFLSYAQGAASRSNDLLLESDAKGIDMPGSMPISSMVTAPIAFALGTPLGLFATYLTLTGLYRGVAAAVGEARPDPVLGLLAWGWRRSARGRTEARDAREREAREGPEVADRLVLPARVGIEGADLVVVASRRKASWTAGTVLDCDGRWFRVGEPVERPFAVGLRTLYPLVETKEAEVFRRVVPYVLPPLPPEG
jgi:hypothetical protein